MMRISLASIAVVIVLGVPGRAEGPAPEKDGLVRPGQTISGLLVGKGQAQTAAAPPVEAGTIVRLGLGALALCAVGVGLVLVRRRRWPGTPSEGAGALQVLARSILSPRHSVYVIRAGDRRIVVGAWADGMAPLAVLEDAPSARAPRHEPSRTHAVRSEAVRSAAARSEVGRSEVGSSEVLRPEFSRPETPGTPAVTEADLLPYRRQVSRLRELLSRGGEGP